MSWCHACAGQGHRAGGGEGVVAGILFAWLPAWIWCRQDGKVSSTLFRTTAEVVLTCMSHAMTTEGEEIMGLLLGDIEVKRVGGKLAGIWALHLGTLRYFERAPSAVRSRMGLLLGDIKWVVVVAAGTRYPRMYLYAVCTTFPYDHAVFAEW